MYPRSRAALDAMYSDAGAALDDVGAHESSGAREGGKRDAQTKRRLFERSGVREYWLVDPELDVVQVFRPTLEGRLARVVELTAEDGDVLTTPLLPGCQIDLRELFRTHL